MFSWLAWAVRLLWRPSISKSSRGLGRGPARQDNVIQTFLVNQLAGYDLFEVTIEQLQDHLAKGHFTSVDYVQYCLSRIRVIDPYVETVIETNPDAEEIAASLDNERAQGSIRGPLHGLPVLVKDNIATKDKMQTTAGSWALLGSEVPRDAHIVSKLREAGAIILGHANMGEWASVRSKIYSTGYSPRKGQVRNPFDLRKSPFGSSSGSAAAVSANIVPLSVGTETDTSIIGPAGINGVVGIKPTVGLTSRSGVIPISENLDSVGTFGRTVADATFGLSAIVGTDERDQFTVFPSRKQADDYSQFLADKQVLKGARFGLPIKRCWELAPLHCKEVAQRVFDTIRDAGAEIVDVDFPSIEERTSPEGTWNWEHGEPSKSEWTVAKIDAYNGINQYLSELSNTPIRTVEDVLTYNKHNEGTEAASPGKAPAFPSGQDNLQEVVDSRGIQDSTYHQALDHIHRQTRENGIDAALHYADLNGVSSQLDALLMCDRRGVGQQYAAQAGYPIITIPIGLDSNGMPVGLSLHQTAWKEAELVKWASAIEHLWNEKNGWRATPTYQNHLAKNIPIEKIQYCGPVSASL